MRVRKESGGTTLTHRNTRYEWPEDGSVADVPPEFAAELFAIRGGGFSEAPESEPAAEFSEVDPGDANPDPGGDDDAPAPDVGEKAARSPRRPRGKSVTES